MAKFTTLTVADIRKETSDAVSIAFELTNEQKNLFRFLPGQYLTFKTLIKGEDVRRSYSICSTPFADEKIRVAVKKVLEGKFSTYANQELKIGDQLEVMPPMGNFHLKADPGNEKHYVAFAAGSGITPIMSIMKSVLLHEPKSEFTLFYGNRNSRSIIFREEIEDLKNVYLDRLRVHHILSREDPGVRLFKGRLDREKCSALLAGLKDVEKADEFFLCGPEEMINNCSDVLKEMNIDENRIHFELFTTPAQKVGKVNQVVAAPKRDPFKSIVRIIMDGDETEFGLESDGLAILDAALEKGLDLPYACKGAVCCTCKAKVLEGKVRMDMNYSLEKDELEAGYVLTCQSHPESKKVVLDFDT